MVPNVERWVSRCLKYPQGGWDVSKWDEMKKEFYGMPLFAKETSQSTVPKLREMQQYTAMALACMAFLDWAEASGISSIGDVSVVHEKKIIVTHINYDIRKCFNILRVSGYLNFTIYREMVMLTIGSLRKYLLKTEECESTGHFHNISPTVH